MSLKGKNALITGSKQGIGKAIAIKLASQGCNIGVNDIVKDDIANETLNTLRKYNVNVSWHKADVSSKHQTDEMIQNFISEHSRIDILINNAVSSIKKPFLEISEQDWEFLEMTFVELELTFSFLEKNPNSLGNPSTNH